MIRRISWTLLACTYAAGLAACATSRGPSIYSYVDIAPTPVSTRCLGGYQVFDKKAENRLLITPYSVSLIAHAACERFSSTPRPGGTGLRYAAAAQEYLDMQGQGPGPVGGRRIGCRLTGGTEIAVTHSEFTYQCAGPAPSTASVQSNTEKVPAPR